MSQKNEDMEELQKIAIGEIKKYGKPIFQKMPPLPFLVKLSRCKRYSIGLYWVLYILCNAGVKGTNGQPCYYSGGNPTLAALLQTTEGTISESLAELESYKFITRTGKAKGGPKGWTNNRKIFINREAFETTSEDQDLFDIVFRLAAFNGYENYVSQECKKITAEMQAILSNPEGFITSQNTPQENTQPRFTQVAPNQWVDADGKVFEI